MPLKGALPRITDTAQRLANGRVRLQAWVLPGYKLALRSEALDRNMSIADILDEILAAKYPDVSRLEEHESEE